MLNDVQVNTNVQQAGVDEYFITLEDAATLNHIVVFLTGQVPFSEGFGGSIYLGWPREEGGVSWQLLGLISGCPELPWFAGQGLQVEFVPFQELDSHLKIVTMTSLKIHRGHMYIPIRANCSLVKRLYACPWQQRPARPLRCMTLALLDHWVER